jgi:putative membrane-bound lytic murein transglycosylase D
MSLFKYLLACAAAVPLLGAAIPVQARTFSTNPPTTVVAPDQVPNPEVNPTEGMLQNVDAQLNTWYVKKYMVVDSTCLTHVADVNVTPEVYKDRLRRLPTTIEMPYNDVVQEYIDAYTGRLRRSVSFMLGAQNFYIPLFEEALEAERLPLELKYLPVIESALEPTATSRVGAAGLWQFMIPTARKFDLTINSLVDERRDPIKSSWAAARYLKELYNKYNDWTLAIAAYNCGPNNIAKAIKRAGGVKDYWAIYPYLPRETRGYVPAFIAANYVMNYYCDHNIPAMKTRVPIETDTVVVTRNISLAQIAGACGLDLEALTAMNPQYRTGVVPGYTAPYAIRMPLPTIDLFLQLGDSVYNYAAPDQPQRREEVTPATTASATASSDNVVGETRAERRARLRQEAAERKAQEAEQRASSKKGKKDKKTKSEKSSKKKNKKERAKEVNIKSGDTLSEIAERNGTTVAKLRKINNIKGNNIRAGKKIRVK